MLLGIGFARGRDHRRLAVRPAGAPDHPRRRRDERGAGGARSRSSPASSRASRSSRSPPSSILSALGLPQDFLRNLAIALLFVLAATLLVPRFGYLLERPLAFMTRRRGGDLGGGFVLGVSLGLVFVPCAGPVLATITALSAQHRIGFDTVLLTLAYARRRRRADAADRARRPARRAAPARAEPELPARDGRRARGRRVRDRLQRRRRACRPRSAATRRRSRSTSRRRRSRRSTSTRCAAAAARSPRPTTKAAERRRCRSSARRPTSPASPTG